MSLRNLLGRRLSFVLLFSLLFVLVQTLVRLSLLFVSNGDIAWDASLVAAFCWGLLFDLGAAAWASLPLVLLLALLPQGAFERPLMRRLLHVVGVLAIGILFFDAAAELIFWDEFGARLNFIAVDYLIYTTEVVSSISQSYNLPLIFGALAGGAAGSIISRLAHRHFAAGPAGGPGAGRPALFERGLVGSRLPRLGPRARLFRPAGFRQQLQPRAGQKRPLVVFRRLPSQRARLRAVLFANRRRPGVPPGTRKSPSPRAATRQASSTRATCGATSCSPRPAIRPNVIQITVESLSAAFLGAYGSADGLTPKLDALAQQSLVFDNFYATGTRTDRGMEALALSVPPTPAARW